MLVTYCGDFMSWLPLWVQLVVQTSTSRMKNFKTRSQDTDVTKNKHASQKNTIPDRKRAASRNPFQRSSMFACPLILVSRKSIGHSSISGVPGYHKIWPNFQTHINHPVDPMVKFSPWCLPRLGSWTMRPVPRVESSRQVTKI